MCRWNDNCKYESDENCYKCDYNYIKTEEDLKEYLEFEFCEDCANYNIGDGIEDTNKCKNCKNLNNIKV